MHSFLHTTAHHREHLDGGKWKWTVLDDQKFQRVGWEYYQPVLSAVGGIKYVTDKSSVAMYYRGHLTNFLI